MSEKTRSEYVLTNSNNKERKMRSSLLSLLKMIVVSAGFVLPVCADLVTVTASQDSYVTGYAPDDNYDEISSGMEIRGGSTSNTRYIYALWDLTGESLGANERVISAQISFVKADTQSSSPGTGTISLYEVTGGSWSETTLTWNNMPTTDSTVLSTVDIDGNDPDDTTVYTFSGTNINALVEGWLNTPSSNEGIRLQSTITWGLIRLYDSENGTAAYQPVLSYDIETIPEPVTIGLMGLGTGVALLLRRCRS